jgi:hypothetical protein
MAARFVAILSRILVKSKALLYQKKKYYRNKVSRGK